MIGKNEIQKGKKRAFKLEENYERKKASKQQKTTNDQGLKAGVGSLQVKKGASSKVIVKSKLKELKNKKAKSSKDAGTEVKKKVTFSPNPEYQKKDAKNKLSPKPGINKKTDTKKLTKRIVKSSKKPPSYPKAIGAEKKDKLAAKAGISKKSTGKSMFASEDGTTMTNIYRLKFKERKAFRKKQENCNYYDRSSKAKLIWEELRKEACKGEERTTLVSKLMNLVKGHLKDLIFAHDTVRVVECLTTHASPEQSSRIFDELKDSIIVIAQNKYAKFYLVSVLRHGTREQKDEIVKAFMGKVVKNIRHVEAASVLEMAYNEHAKAKQRIDLLQEFYGPTFAVFKDQDIVSLKDVLEKNPLQKDSILKHMNDILIKLTDKSVVRHSMIHHVLREYITLSSPEGRAEVIEAYKEHLPEILHTRDGSRAAMMCLWHGTTRDRKTVIKSMKTLVVKICKEENGHMVLLALFDCVDDTKLIEKSILNEIVPKIAELFADPYGRKVLIYLINPRDSHHFHPGILQILKMGDGNAHSKKDQDIRRKELKAVIENPLLAYFTNNVPLLLQSNFNCLFGIAVLQNASNVSVAYEAVVLNLIAEPYTEGNSSHPLEQRGYELLAKKLLLDDAKQSSEDSVAFSDILIKHASTEMLKNWIHCNRGCFLLLRLLETNRPEVVAHIQKAMTGLNTKLSVKPYDGARLLLNKLKS